MKSNLWDRKENVLRTKTISMVKVSGGIMPLRKPIGRVRLR